MNNNDDDDVVSTTKDLCLEFVENFELDKNESMYLIERRRKFAKIMISGFDATLKMLSITLFKMMNTETVDVEHEKKMEKVNLIIKTMNGFSYSRQILKGHEAIFEQIKEREREKVEFELKKIEFELVENAFKLKQATQLATIKTALISANVIGKELDEYMNLFD